ncbi:MAG: hypothetical protein WCT54_00590 [Patescibacteria group bacterium]|jgi:hypothetical protein
MPGNVLNGTAKDGVRGTRAMGAGSTAKGAVNTAMAAQKIDGIDPKRETTDDTQGTTTLAGRDVLASARSMG